MPLVLNDTDVFFIVHATVVAGDLYFRGRLLHYCLIHNLTLPRPMVYFHYKIRMLPETL